MKYFFIVGEKSGDLHASKVAAQLMMLDPNAQLVGWGGGEMKRAGVCLLKHYSSFSLMGFSEVFRKFFRLIHLIAECKRTIVTEQPDAIIYVDFSGFNLRIAQWAAQKGFRNYYYIAPKTWAWNQKRTYKLAKSIHKLFVILPFEKSFFEKFGIQVAYVGNPILDEINHFTFNPAMRSHYSIVNDRPLVVLVPGSRKQEIETILPILSKFASKYSTVNYAIAGVDTFSEKFYRKFINANIQIFYNQTYQLLSNADVAVVTSGTATLETALLGTPQVVVYKTSQFNYLVARLLIRVPFISLVNLIAEKEVVKELIQSKCNASAIEKEVEKLLFSSEIIKSEYEKIQHKIGESGASAKVAYEIFNDLT